MKRYRFTWAVGIVVGSTLLVGLNSPVKALDIPPPPSETAILDQAKIIEDTEEAQLSQRLIDYKKQTGNEIAVLTVKTLDGEDDFDYSYRVAKEWGIGSRESNNGALLFVALQERKIRIQVGRGLEPYLTDLQSSLIIRKQIAPEFRKGNYSGGVITGVNSMISVIGGERLSESPSGKQAESDWVPLLAFLFVPLSYLASFLARSKSWWAGGVIGAVPGGIYALSSLIPGLVVMGTGIFLGLVLDYLLSKNYRERKASGDSVGWWGSGGGFFGGTGGFGGGSSGGGGFGGFGGGSFGGGGSGSSW